MLTSSKNSRTTKNILGAFAFAVMAAGASAGPAMAAAQDASAQSVETLFEGSWTKKSFAASGTWSIVEASGKTYVKLSDDFRTRNAPDLKLFLSPLAASNANGGNATDGSVLIAPLASNSGGQTYEIPAGVDLNDFSSILIHCERFSKLWAASDLS